MLAPISSGVIARDASTRLQDAAQVVAEAGNSFREFLFGFAFDGVARRTFAERSAVVERMTVALDEQPEDFARLAMTGVGVTNLRLALLAMGPPQAPATTPHVRSPQATRDKLF